MAWMGIKGRLAALGPGICPPQLCSLWPRGPGEGLVGLRSRRAKPAGMGLAQGLLTGQSAHSPSGWQRRALLTQNKAWAAGPRTGSSSASGRPACAGPLFLLLMEPAGPGAMSPRFQVPPTTRSPGDCSSQGEEPRPRALRCSPWSILRGPAQSEMHQDRRKILELLLLAPGALNSTCRADLPAHLQCTPTSAPTPQGVLLLYYL